MYFSHYQVVSYAYVIFVNATVQIGKLTIHDQMDHLRCKRFNNGDTDNYIKLTFVILLISLLISDRGSAVKGSYIDASHSGNATTGGQSDWLMSWLGQQNQIFYSTTSGNFPYSFGTKLTTGNSGQPYHLIPAGSSGRRTTTPPYVFIPSDPSQVL